MGKVMEDMVNEATKQEARETKRRLITVAECEGITVEQVREIAGMRKV